MSIRNIVNKFYKITEEHNIIIGPIYKPYEEYIIQTNPDINFFIFESTFKLNKYEKYSNVKYVDFSKAYSCVLINHIEMYDNIKKQAWSFQLPIVLILHDADYPKIENIYLINEKAKYNYVIAPSQKIATNWLLTPNITFDYNNKELFNKTLKGLNHVKHY